MFGKNMKPLEFVTLVAKEKASMLTMYFEPNSGAAVSTAISELNLTAEQKEKMKAIVNDVLTDTFYNFILALDGSASLGDDQRIYDLKDDHGNRLSGSGELESAAWELFQNPKNENN